MDSGVNWTGPRQREFGGYDDMAMKIAGTVGELVPLVGPLVEAECLTNE